MEMKLQGFRRRRRGGGGAAGAGGHALRDAACPGVKASQITALSKDLARSLSIISVRVVEVIPGKSVMGWKSPTRSARS